MVKAVKGLSVLVLFVLLACVRPFVPRESAPTGAHASVTAEEAELRRLIVAWWPAKIAKDSAFFRRILATEFLGRPPTLHEGETTKEEYISRVLRQSLCGAQLIVQERTGGYHIRGSWAAVNVSLRLWLGQPLLSQTESEMFLLLVRRERRWQAVELHEVNYQLHGTLWEKPYFDWRRPTPGEQGRPSGPPSTFTLPPCTS